MIGDAHGMVCQGLCTCSWGWIGSLRLALPVRFLVDRLNLAGLESVSVL